MASQEKLSTENLSQYYLKKNNKKACSVCVVSIQLFPIFKSGSLEPKCKEDQ